MLAKPTLGPVQVLDVYDLLVAETEAVHEHRRMLVAVRTLALHHVQDQIAKLPTEIRDQLGTFGKIETRLERLDTIDDATTPSLAGTYPLSWITEFIKQDRSWHTQIFRLQADLNLWLGQHGTSLRDELGIGTIGAATLLTKIGDPLRFATESKFARWYGTGAVALSSGEDNHAPVRHRLDFGGNRQINSVLYVPSTTQQRHLDQAQTFLARKISERKTKREARRSHKRHLANRVIRRMWKDESSRREQPINTAA